MKRWPLRKAFFWEIAPVFRILLPLAAGIWYYYTPHNFGVPIWVTWSCLFVCVGALALPVILKNKPGRYEILFACTLSLFLFFTGILVSYNNDARNIPNWFGKNLADSPSYCAVITDAPLEKEHSWKLSIRVIDQIKNTRVTCVSGKAFLYLYKDKQPMRLQNGDTILVPGKWEPISNTGNPFEFDYANWCRINNFLYRQFCSLAQVRLYAAHNPAASSLIETCHNWCMSTLDHYLPDPETKGLLQAMLLGDEVNLDEDLRQSYSETGIIHIIAISGGNIAFCFTMISWLFWWLRAKKHLWIKYLVALPLVWFYVVMAGAPPSAVRAALMFSLLAISYVFRKPGNSLNQLFITAFVLLFVRPTWLFSIGFQLSFVAVLSIILFFKHIYSWLAPKNKWLRRFWSAIAASLAAEILVAPLVIYYFHTFATLFLVANVIAYIFMGAAFYLGASIILLSWLPPVASGIAWLTICMVTKFDRFIKWMQGYNPESFHFLSISTFELFLIYFIIGGCTLFLLRRQKPALFAALVGACFLWSAFCLDEWSHCRQKRLVIFNTGKANHIELINGRTHSVLYTDTCAQSKIAYAVKPAHIGWQAWKDGIPSTNELQVIGGKKILILNEDYISSGQFPVDYLVINFTGKPDPLTLKNIFSPSLIIIGNNFTAKQQEQFVRKCQEQDIAVHSMNRNGAFMLQNNN